jgi:hypothetical protein
VQRERSERWNGQLTRFAATPYQPVDAKADRNKWQTGAGDRAGSTMITATVASLITSLVASLILGKGRQRSVPGLFCPLQPYSPAPAWQPHRIAHFLIYSSPSIWSNAARTAASVIHRGVPSVTAMTLPTMVLPSATLSRASASHCGSLFSRL